MVLVICVSTAMVPNAAAYSVKNAFEEIWLANSPEKSEYQMAGFLSNLFLAAELDEETDAFFKFFQKSVKNFDLYELYKSPYLHARGNGLKTVTFHGCNQSERYSINLSTEKNYDHGTLAHLGNLGVELGLKQIKRDRRHARSFDTNLFARMAMKQFNHDALSAWMKGMYHVIDPANIEGLSVQPADVFDSVKGDLHKPIDDYYALFPAQTRFFDQYARLNSFIAFKTHRGQKYTHLEVELLPRMDTLKKDFRLLHDYLTTLTKAVWISLELETTDGLKIMSLGLDSDTNSLFWRLNTRNGKLIPTNAAGEPVFEKEFSISDMDHYQYKGVININVNLYGMRVKSGPITARVIYDQFRNGTGVELKAEEIPTPQIRGRAFKIVPLSLVNLFIPSNIDKLAHQFVRVLATANAGRGTALHLNWETSQPEETVLKIHGQTELLDNRFVNVALRLLGKRFQPDPDTIADMARFLGLFYQKMLPGHRG